MSSGDVSLESVLYELFPSDDPLDSSDFDVTNYINDLFPNESSLSNLDEVISNMNEYMIKKS